MTEGGKPTEESRRNDTSKRLGQPKRGGRHRNADETSEHDRTSTDDIFTNLSLAYVIQLGITSRTDLISFPTDTPKTLARASRRFPIVGPSWCERQRRQFHIQIVHTYNQTAIEPDLLWLRDPQVSKELVDVRKYLLVGDGIGDADCDEGPELGFGEGCRWLAGAWGSSRGFFVSG